MPRGPVGAGAGAWPVTGEGGIVAGEGRWPAKGRVSSCPRGLCHSGGARLLGLPMPWKKVSRSSGQ